MRLGKSCLLGASVGVCCLIAGCGQRDSDPAAEAPAPMPVVQVVLVRRGTLEQVLPVTGTLAALPNMEAALTPQVSGTIEAMPVKFGQHILRGQIVAQISTLPLMGQIQQAAATYGQSLVQVEQAQANALQQAAQTRTDILQAQANLRNAEAALAASGAVLTGDEAAAQNARQNLSREKTLYQDGLVSERDLESAQLSAQTNASQVDAQKQTVEAQRETVAGEQAAVDAAKAGALEVLVKRKDIQVARQQVTNSLGALNSIRAQLFLYTIRAPLSGDVTAIGAGIGESVDPTTKLATVSNLDRLQLSIAAPSSLAGTIRPGDTVVFSSESLPGRRFQTAVETVSPQIDPVSGAVPVMASVGNPGHILKDDMTVSVEIITARHSRAIIVPQAAVLTDADTGAKSVMTVGSDSIARIVSVTTGIEDGGYVEILSGLGPGQRVAYSGQYGIADGTTVNAESGFSAGPAPNGSTARGANGALGAGAAGDGQNGT